MGKDKLRKFRENLVRMDQENSLDAMIDDLLALAGLPATGPAEPERKAA